MSAPCAPAPALGQTTGAAELHRELEDDAGGPLPVAVVASLTTTLAHGFAVLAVALGPVLTVVRCRPAGG